MSLLARKKTAIMTGLNTKKANIKARCAEIRWEVAKYERENEECQGEK